MPRPINPRARPNQAPTTRAAPTIITAIATTTAGLTLIAPDTPRSAAPPTNSSSALKVSGPSTCGTRGRGGDGGIGGAGGRGGALGHWAGGAHAVWVGASVAKAALVGGASGASSSGTVA